MELVDLNGLAPTAGVTAELGKYLGVRSNDNDQLMAKLSPLYDIEDHADRNTESVNNISEIVSLLEARDEGKIVIREENSLSVFPYNSAEKSQEINLTEVNTNVFVVGISGSLGAGANVCGGCQIAIDLNGNVAFQTLVGTGVEVGAAGNASIYAGGYIAPSVYSIEGFGLEEGATMGEGTIVGGGLWQACDQYGNPLYDGIYVNVGVGGEATLVSGHINMSQTFTNASFNIVEWINNILEDRKTCTE